ncbi:MAG: RtcB family protein [Chitinophagaceae bacterium]|nr:RtcB family protein [Chitinophagaceae bacterium]
MAKLKLTGKELRSIGYPQGPVISVAITVFEKHFRHHKKTEAFAILKDILKQPENYLNDSVLKPIALKLVPQPVKAGTQESLKSSGVPVQIFGHEYIDESSLKQMETAARLPVSIAGALMPDAHAGYGLPIGGVLATENAVIPYGVGVDIGCRMCLSVFAIPPDILRKKTNDFIRILQEATLFGAGSEFKTSAGHPVLEHPLFREIPLLTQLHGKAAKQLGTSGSGNHFAEFGIVEIEAKDDMLNIEPGRYVGFLTHSGSRGLGASVANHYTQLAKAKRMLPKEAQHLSWLFLHEAEGEEYWAAMNLAGEYASACHHIIHEKTARHLGETPLRRIENHHNFAWKEIWEGKEVIIHRKGATPAAKNVLGIIPGSMTQPGFIVKGKGEPASLYSASHGAGRKMSRNQAMQSLTDKEVREELERHGVILIGGGKDEAPMVYKNIEEIIKAQKMLVDVLGKFIPLIIRMDDADHKGWRKNREK